MSGPATPIEASRETAAQVVELEVVMREEPPSPRISDVSLVPASPALARGGLLAFASCTVGGLLRVDGLALRRTREGRVVVTYPARRSGDGLQHPFVLPLSCRVRRAIEERLVGEAERAGLVGPAERGGTGRGRDREGSQSTGTEEDGP